jgi:hypothetical protein
MLEGKRGLSQAITHQKRKQARDQAGLFNGLAAKS